MSLAMRKSWSPLQKVGALILATLAMFAIFICWQYWLYKGGIFKTSRFDEHEWKSLNRKTSDSSCYRGGMAHDLQTNVLRTGQPQGEIEKLIGKADFSREMVDSYFLGMCSGLRIDFDTLDVHFNAEGKLTSVHIVQH